MEKEIKSYLIIGKTDFSQLIDSRIAIGKELLSRKITTYETLGKFRIDIEKWSDYNLELLKQSFDNPDNEYRKDYKRSHFIGGYLGSHPLYEDVEREKKKISSYIKGLEKILNKLDLIPEKGKI